MKENCCEACGLEFQPGEGRTLLPSGSLLHEVTNPDSMRRCRHALLGRLHQVADAPLYSIEPEHLAGLRSVAKRLYTEDRMTGDEMRDSAYTIMAAVRFAESLEALRGPGEPYVHVTPKDDDA